MLNLVTALILLQWSPQGELQTEHFTFRYSVAARAEATRLAGGAEEIFARVVADLGVAPAGRTLVRVTATRAEFDAAQPVSPRTGKPNRLPAWVAGVAYPRRNLIIMGPTPAGARRVDRNVLFAHEYSHIALLHAVRFRGLPTWFVEGFADLQAMAPFLRSPHQVGGGALPLGSLHKNLGASHRAASRSYQQSYDFVRFIRQQGDRAQFRRLIALVAGGQSLDAALSRVYGLRTGQFAEKWRSDWNWRNVIIPMITSGGILWILATFLLIFGFIRRRRQRKREIAEMDGPDDEDDEDEDAAFGYDAAFGPRPVGVAAGGNGELAWAQTGGNGPPAPPWVAAGSGFDDARSWAGDEDHEDHEDADEDGRDEGEVAPLVTPGFVFLGIAITALLTALLAGIWPRTRLWLLAAPAAVVTLLALRWAGRR